MIFTTVINRSSFQWVSFFALFQVTSVVDAVTGNPWFDHLTDSYPEFQSEVVAIVQIGHQQISLFKEAQHIASYPVSTSRYGIGNKDGSEQTPLGLHYVRKKIGDDAPIGAVFRGRANTGVIAETEHRPVSTGDDFVTSRILWLSGLEPGKNSGDDVDSFNRYIYIHGTHEEGLIGQPASHGCVRMRNQDVLELYEQMPLDSLVMIVQ